MTDFNDWKSFDYAAASLHLWVFKKSTTASKFRAWHVRTDEAVEKLFRDAISSETKRISESISYGPLAQNNETSCMSHPLEESEGLIALLNQVDRPATEAVDAELKHLKGAAGYLVRFQDGASVIYAIRKTAPSWKPRVRNSLINAIFHNGELSASPDETFSFDSYFDFYCVNETILVSSKRAYESTVSDKKAYERNFEQLTLDSDFLDVFADIEPLKEFVGTNAMHLRRVTVIQQKALYLRPDFSSRLATVSSARNWGINFDESGRIIVCAETVRAILQVLLDHRLLSEITDTTYDVPDAEAVSGN